MTLIVGIICKDGIVLAADGQTTRGSAKSLGAEKINVVKFANGTALVAESGIAPLSAAVIDILQRRAKGREIEDDSTVAKTAEEAIREFRLGMQAHNPDSATPEQWQSFFLSPSNYFELVVGSYWGNPPKGRLYKFNPAYCIPLPVNSYFCTSGIASDLADYVLKEHTQAGMDSAFGSVIAIKTIKDSIENVEGCGEPIRVAILKPPAMQEGMAFRPPGNDILSLLAVRDERVIVFGSDEVKEIALIVSGVEAETKEARNNTIHEALQKKTRSHFEKIMKEHWCHPISEDLREQRVIGEARTAVVRL